MKRLLLVSKTNSPWIDCKMELPLIKSHYRADAVKSENMHVCVCVWCVFMCIEHKDICDSTRLIVSV